MPKPQRDVPPPRRKPAKKVQYKDYAAYLMSKKWEQVKESYKSYAYDFNIEFDLCYFCKSTESIQHHHWKYETDWNDDNCTNLIQVCAGCHTKLHNQLMHNSTMYTTKEEYISDAASVLISVAHLEGFAEGEGIQEKERTDESNAFIDHSNSDLKIIKRIEEERQALGNVLRWILNCEGLHYKYQSGCHTMTDCKDTTPAFVEVFCPQLRVSYFADSFDEAIKIIKRDF